MVYVLNKNGIPLMPANHHGKVRRMLKNGQAKLIVETISFDIQKIKNPKIK